MCRVFTTVKAVVSVCRVGILVSFVYRALCIIGVSVRRPAHDYLRVVHWLSDVLCVACYSDACIMQRCVCIHPDICHLI